MNVEGYLLLLTKQAKIEKELFAVLIKMHMERQL